MGSPKVSLLNLMTLVGTYILTIYISIDAYILGCPKLWRITKNSLHNEGIYKWVNLAPIFFWYELLPTTSGPQKFAKISVFIVDNFVLSIFLVPKLRSVAQIEWKKHPYFFFYFWFKNKRVWTEKIGKKRKNSKNLKVAGNYPNI